MLLPSRKPSSSYSLLKFVYVTSQLRHSLVVHPLLRKILDPPLHRFLFAQASTFFSDAHQPEVDCVYILVQLFCPNFSVKSRL